MFNLKEFAKRSFFVHSAYKFLVRLNEIPLNKWSEVHQIITILRVLPNTMLPLPRLFNAYDCVKILNSESIKGDIVECGVWSGGCVGLMALAEKRTGNGQRLSHLFDSFEGLPQPTIKDNEHYDRFSKDPTRLNIREKVLEGELTAIKACVGATKNHVENFLVQHLKLNPENLKFHIGWFQNTVPQAKH
ncbi:MAG: hypothetical protein HOH19_00880 [Kordiimonadaceae bacterium]|jgi:O-methyltransferase|nr:hypothetical protein [Kordiimonadaceae bacterium]MBT6031102.1 hypothetical protein [Kordiimonadaceae bacterium]